MRVMNQLRKWLNCAQQLLSNSSNQSFLLLWKLYELKVQIFIFTFFCYFVYEIWIFLKTELSLDYNGDCIEFLRF